MTSCLVSPDTEPHHGQPPYFVYISLFTLVGSDLDLDSGLVIIIMLKLPISHPLLSLMQH